MRRRLVFAIAGVATIAVVLLAVPLALILQRSNRDEALLRLQRDAAAATRQIDLAGSGDPVELPPSSDALAVYDRSGRRIAGAGPALAPPVVRTALRTGRSADVAADGRLVVAVPILAGERVSGALRAERSDDDATDDTQAGWLALAGIAAAIVAGAVLAALLLGRRLARPLERIAGEARRLGDGDFSVRTPRTGVPEVDEVAVALDATARRLDDLISRERAFSADASHQLRTPLQALRIELEAIELRDGAPPELAAALAQVDRLQATIDTLLAVARDIPRTGGAADLEALLDEAEGRWRGVLAPDGRPLRISVRAADHVAAGSPGVVAEILDVLLANAQRHGAGAVTVTVHEVEGWLAVDVADAGDGFAGDPEEAFARRRSEGEGHGIGLALARSLADAEGGRLVVLRARPEPILRLLLPVSKPRTTA
jgi:signal transduction histidine kinase